ncbi:hypothetical protein LTR27_009603 [Elasticomyces elasticus]|nr:hypothetical protein LTR27_009603 [Elasticomyces elasticus]
MHNHASSDTGAFDSRTPDTVLYRSLAKVDALKQARYFKALEPGGVNFLYEKWDKVHSVSDADALEATPQLHQEFEFVYQKLAVSLGMLVLCLRLDVAGVL